MRKTKYIFEIHKNMVVYFTKRKVDIKILRVINPQLRVDRNIPVCLWEKNLCVCEEIGVPARLMQLLILCRELYALFAIYTRRITTVLTVHALLAFQAKSVSEQSCFVPFCRWFQIVPEIQVYSVYGTVPQDRLPLLANVNNIIQINVYRTCYAVHPPVLSIFVKMRLY